MWPSQLLDFVWIFTLSPGWNVFVFIVVLVCGDIKMFGVRFI